ncbi:DUF456 family protein [Oscillatoria sp. FACHB-1406]|uniref:DUF456 domain-containing protein n=1 Tax=Oscillatoria sp. FACHB-1406 TaxID=2692846 RepID=UPI001687727D|nr:DUF456 family protein [Oscillatoria sp. FACHB-1406]MBD2576553.1 DUF456 family protein [Oscillatoria sp. FACHB-1406]
MSFTVLYWIVIAVMLVGVVGAVLPAIPGPSLILVALAVWYGATGFAGAGWALVAIFGILILSAAVEYLATYWGAKQLGASKWAQYGAIAGLALGFFGLLPALPFGGPLVGILVGPVFGAFAGEFLYRKDLAMSDRVQRSAKAASGVVIGSVIGNLIEGLLALLAVIIFVFNTWPPVG